MSRKRQALSQLRKEDLEDPDYAGRETDEKPNEDGNFARASVEEMKGRSLKKFSGEFKSGTTDSKEVNPFAGVMLSPSSKPAFGSVTAAKPAFSFTPATTSKVGAAGAVSNPFANLDSSAKPPALLAKKSLPKPEDIEKKKEDAKPEEEKKVKEDVLEASFTEEAGEIPRAAPEEIAQRRVVRVLGSKKTAPVPSSAPSKPVFSSFVAQQSPFAVKVGGAGAAETQPKKFEFKFDGASTDKPSFSGSKPAAISFDFLKAKEKESDLSADKKATPFSGAKSLFTFDFLKKRQTTSSGENADKKEGTEVDDPEAGQTKLEYNPNAIGASLLKKDYVATTGEEDEEVLMSLKLKVYLFSVDQWLERGFGELKVNFNPKKHSARVVMRSEGTQQVVINSAIWKDMPVESMRAKNLKIVVQQDGKLVTYLLKIGTTELRDQLSEKLEEAKKNLKDATSK